MLKLFFILLLFIPDRANIAKMLSWPDNCVVLWAHTHKKTWVIWEGKFNLRKSLNSFAMRALAWTPIYSIVFIVAVSRVFPIFINGQQFTTGSITGNGNNNRNNSCILRSNKDCNFCIQSAKCGWCADPNWTGPRCDTRNWYVILLFYFGKQHI